MGTPVTLVDPDGTYVGAAGGGPTAAQLPATLGSKTAANSLSVAPASDAVFVAGGNVAHDAADAGNPLKIGFKATNAAITPVTNLDRSDGISDIYGNQRVSVVYSAGQANNTNLSSSGLPFSRTDAGSLVLPVAGSMIAAGTVWEYQRKATNALSPYVASSAASGNPAIGKNAAGDLFGFEATCGATAAWLILYNVATLPVVGTTAIARAFPLAINSKTIVSIPGGLYFATGIGFAFATSAAGGTGSAAAAVTDFNLFIG